MLAVEKPVGERVAHMEGILQQVLPAIERMEAKLDEALEEARNSPSKESVKEAHDRIDQVEKVVNTKADKTELKEVRDKVLLWSGGLVVIAALVGWFGQKLIEMLAAK